MAPGPDDIGPFGISFAEGTDRDASRAALWQQELLKALIRQVRPPDDIAAGHLAFSFACFAQVPVYASPASLCCNGNRSNDAVTGLFPERVWIAFDPHPLHLLPGASITKKRAAHQIVNSPISGQFRFREDIWKQTNNGRLLSLLSKEIRRILLRAFQEIQGNQ